MNSEYDLFPGTRPIYPASANGFDPLKAQFRRAEIYKRALEKLVEDHQQTSDEFAEGNYTIYLNYNIDSYIDFARWEWDLKHGK